MSDTGSSLMEKVILVDDRDHPVGVGEKLDTHVRGLRHRAFSIFIFNQAHEILLQKRAQGKYHSGQLWANACCGHPRPGETAQEAAKRRVFEELGLADLGELTPRGFISYKLPVGTLWEHEMTHLFQIVWEGEITDIPFSPHEVEALRWVSFPYLVEEIQVQSERFAPWLLFYLKHRPDLFSFLD